jgi:hypothetical protein
LYNICEWILLWRKKQYDLSVFAAAVPGGRDIYAGEIFSLAQKL